MPYMSGPHDVRDRRSYTNHTGSNGFSGFKERFMNKPKINDNLRKKMD